MLRSVMLVAALLGVFTPPALAGQADDLRPGEVREVAESAHPARNLAVAPDGTIYLAGNPVGEVYSFVPDEGVARTAGRFEPFAEHVLGTRVKVGDMAVGADGTLYLTAENTIHRMTPDGTVTVIGGGGSLPEVEADGGPATALDLDTASGIDVDAQGSVYVASGLRTDAHILKIDRAGTLTVLAGSLHADQLPADGSPATGVRLDFVLDVAVSPAGMVYFTVYGGGTGETAGLWRIMPDGTLDRVFDDDDPGYTGDGGPAAEARVDVPLRLAFAGADLYFLDWKNRRIRSIDETGVIDTVGPPLTTTDIAVGPDGELYATSESSVVELSREGGEQEPVTPRAGHPLAESAWADQEPGSTHTLGELHRSVPIAATPSGAVSVIVDGKARTFDRAAAPGTTITGDGDVRAFAGGPDGSLYYAVHNFTDDNDFVVVRQYPDGAVAPVVGGGQGTIDGRRATAAALVPTELTVGQDGRLYVASELTDNGEAGVARLNDDGTLTLVVPTPGSDVEAVNGIAVAADGTIYLADTTGARVHRFDRNGKSLGAEELHPGPTDVAVTRDGTRYVASPAGVTEIRPDGDSREVTDAAVTGLATDPHGNLFLTREAEGDVEIVVVVRPGAASTFPWTWLWIAAGVVVVLAGGWFARRRRRRHDVSAM